MEELREMCNLLFLDPRGLYTFTVPLSFHFLSMGFILVIFPSSIHDSSFDAIDKGPFSRFVLVRVEMIQSRYVPLQGWFLDDKC